MTSTLWRTLSESSQRMHSGGLSWREFQVHADPPDLGVIIFRFLHCKAKCHIMWNQMVGSNILIILFNKLSPRTQKVPKPQKSNAAKLSAAHQNDGPKAKRASKTKLLLRLPLLHREQNMVVGGDKAPGEGNLHQFCPAPSNPLAAIVAQQL